MLNRGCDAARARESSDCDAGAREKNENNGVLGATLTFKDSWSIIFWERGTQIGKRTTRGNGV